MKLISTIVGATILMSQGSLAGKDKKGHHDCHEDDMECIFRGKIRGTIHGVIKMKREDYHKEQKDKHKERYHFSCSELCWKTRACREDPHAHGSYCKTDHYPPVCFGLYHVPKHAKCSYGWGDRHTFGRLCYEPNSPFCPEGRPVLCHEKPYKPYRDDEKEKFEWDDEEEDQYDD
jgi:hypothetical protein